MLYPNAPVPSSVSMPEIIDPMLSVSTDQGYSIRRPRYSRPRRRWTLEYLGLNVANLRILRNYLMFFRLGVTTFEWYHPTAVDVAAVSVTTPVQLDYIHGLYTGWWLGVSNSPNPGLNGGAFQVTVTSQNSVLLNGTTAAGIAGICTVVVYVPRMLLVAQEGTLASPATLIGPDQLEHVTSGRRTGYYTMTVQLEEQF